MKYDIKEMIRNNKKVTFEFYRQKELWYKTECGFEFPVPIDDTGNGVFLNEDKAMLFMRYIRKHIESIKIEEDMTHSSIG
jgi:hypothetical protein